jgi:hypothetical protein
MITAVAADDDARGLHFAGGMIRLCAQNLRGTGTAADFDDFELKGNV